MKHFPAIILTALLSFSFSSFAVAADQSLTIVYSGATHGRIKPLPG